MAEIAEIIANMRKEYLENSRPWIIGFSGGKDSTCLLQLVFEMLKSIPDSTRKKRIYVLSTETMVESPAIVSRQRHVCELIQEAVDRDCLPIEVKILRPEITDTFWVNLIGRGYPSPNKWFRWCTDRLKIKPMNDYVHRNIKRNGEVIVLLGARKSESSSRSQTMGKHEIENFWLRRHGSIPGAFVYTPIQDMEEDEVWEYLLSHTSPWNDDNRALWKLYRGENTDVPFIISKDAPPSGHSRFGCWTCTVVEKDKALLSLISDGHDEYKPLLDFRDKLKRIRDDPNCREKFRKNQRLEKFYMQYINDSTPTEPRNSSEGYETLGPFTLKTRHSLLIELLEIQKNLRSVEPNTELITPEEIKAIELAWIYDGDNIDSIEALLCETINLGEDTIEKLIDRLLVVERDMSDLSRRIGVYKKLEQVIYEFAMNTAKIEDGST
jgi:DNA sulfur modification protein DndC